MPAPELLYLSHCVPNPPDKGERIRAHHELKELARRYRVHLVCFGKTPAELRHAAELQSFCASVYAELLPRAKLAKAALRFLVGSSLTAAFYSSSRMRNYIARFNDGSLTAAIAYSTAMFQYIPRHVRTIVDMVDVDSEKWRQYAAARVPSFAYNAEARRLRNLEQQVTARAAVTFLATEAECQLLHSFCPGAKLQALENGVDLHYFDPNADLPASTFRPFPFVVFVGAMDYFPNADAVDWFSDSVAPALRAAQPNLHFLIVGRNPGRRLRALASRPGIEVTGEVEDIRPYLSQSTAFVAPLRIARGIQNKVLEALAMGKPVLCSEPVLRTFGNTAPIGLFRCTTPEDYTAALQRIIDSPPSIQLIRNSLRMRSSWATNLNPLMTAVEELCSRTPKRVIAGVS